MIPSVLSQWLLDLPAYALLYLVAFGVRIGTFQIHGIVTSFWVGAQHLGGIDTKLTRIDAATMHIPEMVERTKRIEGHVEEPKEDAIRLSIPR